MDADFSNKIIFSDEFVNQQNCRIWDWEKSRSICCEANASTACRFGADFGLEVSSEHSSLKMRLVGH